MESSSGVVSHCDYRTGSCALADGKFLIWKSDVAERCEFVVWKVFDGEVLGDNWLESNGRLALSLRTDLVPNCNGQKLYMSAQGIAYEFLTAGDPQSEHPGRDSLRTRRDVNGPAQSDGIATSAYLAARLQGILRIIHKDLKQAFNQAMAMTCRNADTALRILKASVAASPTLAMRQLLRRQSLYGRASGRVIEVWPCYVLPPNDYKFTPLRFVAMNKSTCYSDVPILFKLNGIWQEGYLDKQPRL